MLCGEGRIKAEVASWLVATSIVIPVGGCLMQCGVRILFFRIKSVLLLEKV